MASAETIATEQTKSARDRLIAARRASDAGEMRFFEVGDGAFEGLSDHLNHLRVDRKRWGDQNVISAFAIGTALRRISHHS